jgi:tryptophanyl-tRNA synthetase
MKRYLSGVQPSGLLHLGNYFGAIQLHLERAREHEAYYFIADLHALTTVREPARLAEYVREVAVTYLALGLDPERTVFWRQSEVPEVTEIAWLLATVTGMGLLERAHGYKDKVARGLPASVGLFYYPVLMAADILAFDADLVPVGRDQVQHIEFAQDMAGYWKEAYGPVFRRPEWELSRTPRVPGLDGQKMSKSYGNALWIFEEGKSLRKAVGRIPTDSRPPAEPKDPASMLILEWLALVLAPAEHEELCARVRLGGSAGPGYGELKERLVHGIESRFAEARARRAELLGRPGEVEAVLARGAARARDVARAVRDRAYASCGLRPSGR